MELNIIPQPRRMTVLDETVKNPRFEEFIREEMDPEEYRILITRRECTLEAGSKLGLIHARSTLEQIRFQCELPDNALPCLFIEDKPVAEYRSFHYDSCRHFIPMEELKKLCKTASLFKFNRFHWHVSEDQGWRIESRRFPKLHELGSVRKGDHFGTLRLDEEQGGYYTRDEVRDLVRYCEELGIEIVPEIDLPGHTSAILHAYPELGCTGEPVEVKIKEGIFPDILCAGKEEVYTFLTELLDEMCELFPGRFFHIGGDEAPKNHWLTCPHCQARMKEEGLKDIYQLQGYFENRLIDHLAQKGKIAVVWNDATHGGNLNPNAVIQLWKKDLKDTTLAHVRRGGEVINSISPNAYCDYPYALYSLKGIYSLEISPKKYVTPAHPTVYGTEVLCWTEFIRTKERLEEYSWPRYAASAEAGWCGNQKPGYRDFKKRLLALFPIFEQYGIHAMPPEGWTPGPVEKVKLLREFYRQNFKGRFKTEIQNLSHKV